MTTLNCITVDDEPLALGLVSAFVDQTPFLNLVGKFGNAVQALQAIHSMDIQLVFLDIQMPDLNGMELARVLSKTASSSQTKIIFTTAYNQFAVEGYKVDALGYLLKPFGYEEFLETSMKAKRYFDQIRESNAVPDVEVREDYLFVKADYKLVRIDFESIIYIESLKDYVKIHLTPPAKPVMTLSSLKAIEEKLAPGKFLRLHRSFIVAVNKIDSISKNAVHVGNIDISVGDLYKEAFKELLARWS
ncbi:two component transcriptional regulator, LytTR family [Dyadobacter koreensis]|uniref:Two component transcriptional regulator, LytTR family n=1 Tax=Dyadobacter koreensis TaxID=408657 RepID=A0A1H6PZR9_9BACT|nr:LytTR family DNA-binding domain-containing protein [Dyadobacter koreensis]SEI37123.1 two component transcriptional regulator, LytTR family [Dyadobacter koreensis]